jgi:hypothetical protein
MLKNNLIKNKKGGSAGDMGSIVVTFVLLILIFLIAFSWTRSIILKKNISLENIALNKDSLSLDSISPVIYYKNIIANILVYKINSDKTKNDE